MMEASGSSRTSTLPRFRIFL
jgi:transposase InsO family protein